MKGRVAARDWTSGAIWVRGPVGWSSVGAEMSKVGWWWLAVVVVVELLLLLLLLPVRCFTRQSQSPAELCVDLIMGCVRWIRVASEKCEEKTERKKTVLSRGLSAQPSVEPATQTQR